MTKVTVKLDRNAYRDEYCEYCGYKSCVCKIYPPVPPKFPLPSRAAIRAKAMAVVAFFLLAIALPAQTGIFTVAEHFKCEGDSCWQDAKIMLPSGGARVTVEQNSATIEFLYDTPQAYTSTVFYHHFHDLLPGKSGRYFSAHEGDTDKTVLVVCQEQGGGMISVRVFDAASDGRASYGYVRYSNPLNN